MAIPSDKKKCKTCGEIKDTDEFHKHRIRKDGLNDDCIPCRSKQRREEYSKRKREGTAVPAQKTCGDCGETKSASEFHRNYGRDDGLRWECKTCHIRQRGEYQTQRRKNDPYVRMVHNLRRRHRKAIRQKTASTEELLGCSWEELKDHIEAQFTEGMTWEMIGQHIHLDHIIPLASFDLTKEDEQRKAMHYTNLQPLWAKDNLSKGSKMPHELES